ncbi:MAG: polysaccharide deacetylase family protein [Candidatus Ryanbacteria bacterium]|nr:polysaccharide deacetylase family protein [Candidatus Ryanbacteria bacterium]
MNKPKKIVAGLLWQIGLGPLFRAVYEPKRLAICYHSITDSGQYDHIRIAIKDFTYHVEYLAARGYRFVKFSELASAQGRVAAIYFDDGFHDIFTNAKQILEQKNIPATLFVTTAYADGARDPASYASWDEIAALGGDWEIGSHSVSHRKLTKISKEEVRQEMAESKRIIEAKIGRIVTVFSYPHGRASGETEVIAREVGYAMTTASKSFYKVRPDPDDSLEVFYWKTLKLW